MVYQYQCLIKIFNLNILEYHNILNHSNFNVDNRKVKLMNYYDEIKEQIINNKITKKVKDYSKNKSDLTT